MGIWDRLKTELIDIVQYLGDAPNVMAHRFERFNNEIKNGAKLVVREGQVAVFIDEGRLADVFAPGTYTLSTANVPILATLKGWKYGFESPFKCEVYFVATRVFTDLKWGTMNPVMLRDAEFGPVRLRAFGTYALKVKDAGAFIKQIVGTAPGGDFTTDDIVNQLRNNIVARFGDVLGECKIPALDLASRYDELAAQLGLRITPELDPWGLELNKLLVENISLPPEVEQAMDKRSSMGVIGNLNAYGQYQAANAMEEAAKNPGAPGSMMGMMMAGRMGQTVAGVGSVQGGPPAMPGAAGVFLAINGQQAGPFSPDQLREQIKAGKLTRDTLVWMQGMVSWSAAAGVPEVAALLGSTPPPMPS